VSCSEIVVVLVVVVVVFVVDVEDGLRKLVNCKSIG